MYQPDFFLFPKPRFPLKGRTTPNSFFQFLGPSLLKKKNICIDVISAENNNFFLQLMFLWIPWNSAKDAKKEKVHATQAHILLLWFFPPFLLLRNGWRKLERGPENIIEIIKELQQGFHISSVQSLSHVWLFVTPWTAACQASLHYLLEFAQTHVPWISDAIQPSHPVISFSCLRSFPASGSFQMSQLFTSGIKNST